jgi:hypothetical protein
MNSELDSCGSTGNGEGFYLGNNDSTDGSGNYTIMNNYVHDTFFECLEVKQGTDPSMIITNNTFEHCHRNNHSTEDTPGGDSGTGVVATGASGGNSQVQFFRNWIKDVVGTENNHSGVGARWQSQGIDARYNVIVNNQGEGLVAKGSSDFPQNWVNNTFFNNGRECTNISGTAKTVTDNICWGNASDNDASNPQFVAAASNNFNLSTGSPALGTGAGGTNKGALQTFAWTSASLLSDGITIRVTGAVNSLFQPLSSGTASAFTLTCSTAGAQSGQTFTPSGSTDALITVATPIAQGETCTLAATAGAAQDSANIGGALAPGGPLNSTSLAITELSVTNGSTNVGTAQIPSPKRFRIVGETLPNGSIR